MEQLDKLIKDLQKAGVNTKAFEAELAKVKAGLADGAKLAETMKTTLAGVAAAARGLNTEFTSIRQNLAANLAEIAKTNSAVQEGVKAYRGLTSIVSNLASEEEGIQKFTKKQLADYQTKGALALRDLKVAGNRLAIDQGITNLSGAQLENKIAELLAAEKIDEKQAAILRARADGYQIEEKSLALIEARLQKEQMVQKSIGLTGAALSGVNTILGKLGLGGLSDELDSITNKIQDNMRKEIEALSVTEVLGGVDADRYIELDKINSTLDDQITKLQEQETLNAEETALLEKSLAAREANTEEQKELVRTGKAVVKTTYEELSLRSKISHLAKGTGDGIAAAFNKIGDPGVIFAFVGKALLGASDQAAKFQRSLNVSAGTAYMLQREFQIMEGTLGSNFITSEKLGKSFMALSDYMGQNASAMMKDGGTALKSYTYLTDKLHLSADAAGQLGTATRLSGQNTEDAFDAMGDQLTAFNKTNKSAFRLNDLMADVGKMSKAVVLQLDKSPQKLLAAAAAARKLGVNMEQLEAIGESLLNFESSIEKELEAQLLTGNALNLNRARELYMMGDMEGLATEIGNQEAIRNAFATKNVIAQKAAAEALGMSREQLAQMTYQQELNTMNAEAFVAKYGEVAYKSAKAQSAQDKFNDALTKMQSILANVVGMFSPIIDALAYIVSFPLVPYIMAGVVAIKALGGGIGSSIKGMGSLVGKFKELSKGGLLSGIKDKAVGLKDKAVGLFKQGKEGIKDGPMSKTMDKGSDLTGKVKDKTKGASGAQGPGGYLKSLGDGLASIGKKFGQVVKGTLALGLAAVAIVGPFAGALLLIKDVNPATIAAFSLGVGILGGSLALLGKMSGNVIKGGIALAAAGAGILAASYGFSLLEGVNPDVVKAVVGSLLVLGTGAALLGALSGNIITGAVALGILGLAMVPAAFALSLLENVDIGKIVAFSAALPLLALATAGLGFLAPFIMAGAAALAVLGAAMIPAAIAFNIMAKADLEKIGTGLTAIASVGPQLALAGIGMVALAGGAAVLGLASPMLLFAGGALAVLGMAAQLASNANIEGIASQLTQLAGIGPGLVAAGIGLFAVSGGLTAFALAMAGASALGALTSIFGGGVMGDLEALAAMAEPLSQVGVSLTAIAAGLSGIALALSTLETEKINELKGLVMTTAMAAPMVAASGAITELISGITGGGEDSSNQELLAEIKLLRAAVEAGGDVFIDGNKAGNAMLLSSYKSS